MFGKKADGTQSDACYFAWEDGEDIDALFNLPSWKSDLGDRAIRALRSAAGAGGAEGADADADG